MAPPAANRNPITPANYAAAHQRAELLVRIFRCLCVALLLALSLTAWIQHLSKRTGAVCSQPHFHATTLAATSNRTLDEGQSDLALYTAPSGRVWHRDDAAVLLGCRLLRQTTALTGEVPGVVDLQDLQGLRDLMGRRRSTTAVETAPPGFFSGNGNGNTSAMGSADVTANIKAECRGDDTGRYAGQWGSSNEEFGLMAGALFFLLGAEEADMYAHVFGMGTTCERIARFGHVCGRGDEQMST